MKCLFMPYSTVVCRCQHAVRLLPPLNRGKHVLPLERNLPQTIQHCCSTNDKLLRM